MQFERVHLDVFSTSRFATLAISLDWILKFKFHSFKTDTMWHKNKQTQLQKLLIFRDSHGPPTDLLERVIIFRHSLQLTPTDPFRCLDYASVHLYLINSTRLVSLFWAWKDWVWVGDFRHYWSRLWMPRPKDHDVTACFGSTQVVFQNTQY